MIIPPAALSSGEKVKQHRFYCSLSPHDPVSEGESGAKLGSEIAPKIFQVAKDLPVLKEVHLVSIPPHGPLHGLSRKVLI